MKQHHITHNVVMVWLWATFFGLLAFIVLVGGFMLYQKQVEVRDTKRVAEAQEILEELGDIAYEFSGDIMKQVEALQRTPTYDAWQVILRDDKEIAPQEIAFYHADNSGADIMTRNAQGAYATVTKQFPSRAVPLFQRAQTLRSGEVYITPNRRRLACDYEVCDTESTLDVYAYVTPVYDGAVLLGALVVAYDTEMWERRAQNVELPIAFFAINAQGYYIVHDDDAKINERKRHLPSSFFTDFDQSAAENILVPSGGRVVDLATGKHAYIYAISPLTEMIRDGTRENIHAPATAPANQYFVIGFIE